MNENYTITILNLKDRLQIRQLESFLHSQELSFENNLEVAFGILQDNTTLVGCGCATGSLLKCFALSPTLRGQNLLGSLLSELMQNRFDNGYTNLYVITKEEYHDLFVSCGFTLLIRTNGISMLENQPDGLTRFTRTILPPPAVSTGAIVMNGNPFTKGHLSLIERAADQCGHLLVFLVEEDKSLFPTSVRLKMAQEGCAHLSNVSVHLSGHYMISAATFPTYFLKEKTAASDLQARMDITLFAQKVAPALGITKRFIGEEPSDAVTALYNRIMKELLPNHGIDVIEVPRITWNHIPISASRVRALLSQEDLAEIANLVPPTTLPYLKTTL